MSKVLTIAGVSILALGLVLGLALPALAAPPAWARPGADDSQIMVVKGKVLSVDEEKQEYFVIQSGEQELTISVDGDIKYFKLCVPVRIVALARHRMGLRLHNQIPQLDDGDMPKLQRAKLKRLRLFGEGAEFGDIAVGDRVAVWLAPEENNLAERVLIIKPTTYARVSGTISVSLEEKTVTIAPDDGVAVTLDYNEGTVFILNGFIAVEEGQYAHAIYDSDNMVAKRVVVYQEVP